MRIRDLIIEAIRAAADTGDIGAPDFRERVNVARDAKLAALDAADAAERRIAELLDQLHGPGK